MTPSSSNEMWRGEICFMSAVTLLSVNPFLFKSVDAVAIRTQCFSIPDLTSDHAKHSDYATWFFREGRINTSAGMPSLSFKRRIISMDRLRL